jgi:hypothetical protein
MTMLQAVVASKVTMLLDWRPWCCCIGQRACRHTHALFADCSRELLNTCVHAASEQPPQIVTLQVSLATDNADCGAPICDILGAAAEYTTLTTDSVEEVVTIQLASPDFLRAQVAATFTVSKVWETIDVPNSDTIVTVMLASNVYIRNGNDVTISGLRGTQTPTAYVEVFLGARARARVCVCETDVYIWWMCILLVDFDTCPYFQHTHAYTYRTAPLT